MRKERKKESVILKIHKERFSVRNYAIEENQQNIPEQWIFLYSVSNCVFF